jgi:hypothetical protein
MVIIDVVVPKDGLPEGAFIATLPLTTRLLVPSVKFRFALLVPPELLIVSVVHASARPEMIVTVSPLGILAVSPAPGNPVGVQVDVAFQFPLLLAV